MADTKTSRLGRSGPYQLLRKFDEVGPELGHLYESRHTLTGDPAVTLRPGDRMHWLHRGPWRIVIASESDSPDVSLHIERAPAFAPPSQVADQLVLMNAAFRYVEDSPRLQAHFAAGPVRPRTGGLTRVLAALVVMGLGALFWLRPAARGTAPNCPVSEVETVRDAPALIDTENPTTPGIAYPLPQVPFRNQAKAPCKTQFEVEINGGCWVALEQKPPCADVRAEYEGKCYLPVAKDRGRPPQSTVP